MRDHLGLASSLKPQALRLAAKIVKAMNAGSFATRGPSTTARAICARVIKAKTDPVVIK